MSSRIRVLIVDDSAFARKVLREVLTQDSQVEVVGIARDGLEALEKFAELKPDVMTLDLVMPNLDGLGVLDGLSREERGGVVIVSTASSESDLAISALERGAFDLVNKPTALATARLYELGTELLLKVHAAAAAKLVRASAGPAPDQVEPAQPAPPRRPVSTRKLLVIGTSTGGPQALTRLLTALPADFPVPIAVALHIPPGYTDALARRIDNAAAIEVLEADNGIELRPGRAVIARGGMHLRVQMGSTGLTGWLSSVPSDSTHFPSVDVLFESAVDECGAGVVGLVLTGMGDDGRRGSKAIQRAGGFVITESASSCVVYGMPRSVVEAGLSNASVSLYALPNYLSTEL
ncbi:MAG: Chemotaxis response regulator protein-glutamate methylesterase CheB [Myxococcaceae bacterium]|nr:Chemotaxis response regulator protein-glutamate methylesterase CheB [Myxococcaceae bacterium]